MVNRKIKKNSKKVGDVVLVKDGYRDVAYESTILEIKKSPGGISYYVEPVRGIGKIWVRNII